MATITELDTQLQTLKTEYDTALTDFNSINSLIKDVTKIYNWIKYSNEPKTLITTTDANGVVTVTNQADFDLYNNRFTIFDDYLLRLGMTKDDFLESIFRSKKTGSIFSEVEQKLQVIRRDLQTTISTKSQEIEIKKKELIDAMALYHNINI